MVATPPEKKSLIHARHYERNGVERGNLPRGCPSLQTAAGAEVKQSPKRLRDCFSIISVIVWAMLRNAAQGGFCIPPCKKGVIEDGEG